MPRAALGAVLVLVLGSQLVGGLGLPAAAFLGSLVALGVVYLLAQRSGRITAARLLLSGVAVAYLFQALFSYVLLQAQSGQVAQQVLFWLLGSLAGARWDVLPVPAAALTVGLVVLLVQWRPHRRRRTVLGRWAQVLDMPELDRLHRRRDPGQR